MKAILVRGALVAGALVLLLTGPARSASAQITGCCIGPVCTNKTARSCTASGGTALSSTCTSSQDPRCGGGGGGACAGLSGAAAGLCNAYCNGLRCADGRPGRACDALRENWRRVTGLPYFPCDPVCCECPDGARQCASARRCERAGCAVVDRCVNGQCPEPVCCQCAGGCAMETPRLCWRHGCAPAPGAMCTTAGTCERPCGPIGFHQCGGTCPNPGEVCQPDAADAGCVCVADCPCGTTCTDPNGNTGICQQTDPTNPACTCVVPPPPPDCPCGATCTDPNGNTGLCKQIAVGSPECGCVVTPPPPDCPCQSPCQIAGAIGVCLPTAANPTVCTCTMIIEPPACPCGASCQINGAVGLCRQTDPTNPNDCSCVPLP